MLPSLRMGRLESRFNADDGQVVPGAELCSRHRCGRIAGDDDRLHVLRQEVIHDAIDAAHNLVPGFGAVGCVGRVAVKEKALLGQLPAKRGQGADTAHAGVKYANGAEAVCHQNTSFTN